jgi:hypothetical protein
MKPWIFAASRWYIAISAGFLATGIAPAPLDCLRFSVSTASAQNAIEMEIIDDESGEPISARITFTKSAKKLVRPKKLLFAGEQWLFETKAALSPPVGEYEFLVQRGPEFKEIRGGFTIEPKAKDTVLVEVPRAVDMHAENWFSGDHLSSMPMDQLRRWQMADAVDMIVSTSIPTDAKATQSTTNPATKNTRSKRDKQQPDNEPPANTALTLGLQLSTSSQRLSSPHANVLIHGIPQPAGPTANEPKDTPETKISPKQSTTIAEMLMQIEESKRSADTLSELVQPWTRDVPLLLATNGIGAVQILSSYNRLLADDRLIVSPSDGSQRMHGTIQLMRGKEKIPSELFAPIPESEELRLKGGQGVGKLSEYIYWKMLDAGLRIAPTAGSDFGNSGAHVGYNRVYIQSSTPPNNTIWWQTVRQGCTMVTNGPLLRVNINGMPPGSVQASYRSQPISLDISAALAVREAVDYLDVVFNGTTIYSAKLEDHFQKGEFPPIEITEPGWLVVRVVTAHDKGYRLATTAPFYFEFDDKRRINRDAVLFFQQWLEAAISEISDQQQLDEYGDAIDQARTFWQSKLEQSR